jgi:hypothetical protein
MYTPTFKDLLDFVLKNKTNKVFIGCSVYHIAHELEAGISNETLLYNLDSTGNITGMILAEKDDSRKLLFITRNLAMSLAVLKEFARIAKERFPDYTLEWKKNGIHKKHNTLKIYEKLNPRRE